MVAKEENEWGQTHLYVRKTFEKFVGRNLILNE